MRVAIGWLASPLVLWVCWAASLGGRWGAAAAAGVAGLAFIPVLLDVRNSP
ncbi:hypothetical protein [Paenarthrobacter nitroguajacolicus]|uniref:hypothetical protein n=1 Tax=Paenarthrobacter nitroguajacolicus TaxID=211146 RepID=UPI0015C07626|nr:hypothetical protein [Paenarthrobacter nitroguajacolicus]